MLDIAFKNISARKTRSGLCILGVMICVYLIGTMQGLSNQMEETVMGDVARSNDKLYLQQKGAMYPPFGSSLDERIGNAILSRDDINPDESTNILFVVIEPAETPRDLAKVFGVGLIPGKEKAYIGDAQISNGDITLVGESENAVVLGKSAADFYNVNVGDELTVREDMAKVVGVLKQTDVANIDSAVLMSLSFGQSAFGRRNMSSAVLITPGAGHSVDEIENDIESGYINLEVKTQREIEDELDASLETPRRILGMINAVAFVVTIVIITNVMMMSVKEKTREIGTMRAIGTQRSVVILIIFYETLILSILGGILGMLIIIPGSYVVGISWLPALLSPAVLLRIAVLIFFVGVFSGLLPAYFATRISPLEALRYE
jgi:putative ABC transport system permease protein